MVKKLRINQTIVQKNREKIEQSEQLLNIDENERKVLRTLLFNPRLSYREIARMTDLSVATVSEKIRKLMTNRIIKGFHADIDAKKLGYELTAIIELIAPKLELIKAMEKITKLPNVYAIYHTTGDVDMIVIAKFRTVDELQNFLGKLYNFMAIQRSETRIVLKTIKEDFRVKV